MAFSRTASCHTGPAAVLASLGSNLTLGRMFPHAMGKIESGLRRSRRQAASAPVRARDQRQQRSHVRPVIEPGQRPAQRQRTGRGRAWPPVASLHRPRSRPATPLRRATRRKRRRCGEEGGIVHHQRRHRPPRPPAPSPSPRRRTWSDWPGWPGPEGCLAEIAAQGLKTRLGVGIAHGVEHPGVQPREGRPRRSQRAGARPSLSRYEIRHQGGPATAPPRPRRRSRAWRCG